MGGDSSSAPDCSGGHCDRKDGVSLYVQCAPPRLPGGIAPVVLVEVPLAEVGAVDDGEGVPHRGDRAEPAHGGLRERLPLTPAI